MPDIDIDVADRERSLEFLSYTAASRSEAGKLIKHNTGIYLQKVPVDVNTGLCQLAYNDNLNDYFKIDILPVNIYKDVKNEQHLKELMEQEPLWDLLEQTEFVDLLFHLNGHSDVLKKTKPKSVEQLAAVLAMIRPAKRYLIGKDWIKILDEIWTKPDKDEYYFKKSHATAYALAIVVHMNLICEKLSYGFS
jgi:DNA polymerase III alpha subunit